MRAGVDGLKNFKPPEPLDRTWYKVEVDEVKVIEKQKGNDSVLLVMTILEGPIQQDTSDPVGRELDQFLTLGTSGMTKKGAQFVLGQIANACEAFGVEIAEDNTFDPEDFRGKIANAFVNPKVNKMTNKLEDRIQEFKKLE